MLPCAWGRAVEAPRCASVRSIGPFVRRCLCGATRGLCGVACATRRGGGCLCGVACATRRGGGYLCGVACAARRHRRDAALAHLTTPDEFAAPPGGKHCWISRGGGASCACALWVCECPLKQQSRTRVCLLLQACAIATALRAVHRLPRGTHRLKTTRVRLSRGAREVGRLAKRAPLSAWGLL